MGKVKSPPSERKKMPSTYTFRTTAVRVADAIEPFIEHKVADDKEVRTIKRYRSDLKQLLEVTGNLYLEQITPQHIDRTVSRHNQRGNVQGSKNNMISDLRQFFHWARLNKYISPFEGDDPTCHLKRKKYEPEQPPFIPQNDFGKILDLAGERSPIHRMFFALGLYLMARGPSELGPLQLWDLRLGDESWSIRIRRVKTKSAGDYFELSTELCGELSRYLAWYNAWALEHLGTPVQREWYLLPRTRNVVAPGHTAADKVRTHKLYPQLARSSSGFGRLTGPVLDAYGFPTVDPETGERNGWGGTHTLRKSGGRAWYEELRREKGRDNALDIIQEAYGHATRAVTEQYLGLKRGQEERNDVLRGAYMFKANDPAHQADDGTLRLQPVAPEPYDREGALAGLPEWFRAA